ncbi:hypothetical protein [Halalkalicoccus jeotgali]|uniref:hypothetical protein n=1 Tax=Halalkalicoccus jeotgali TaxID=413810 RepID=UPI0011D2644B|nr:hypothetical protein [Halalkalicoccus jeotgali]
MVGKERTGAAIFGGVAISGLMVVLVAVGLAGVVGPALGTGTTTADAGPPIAAVGVLLSTVALARSG